MRSIRSKIAIVIIMGLAIYNINIFLTQADDPLEEIILYHGQVGRLICQDGYLIGYSDFDPGGDHTVDMICMPSPPPPPPPSVTPTYTVPPTKTSYPTLRPKPTLTLTPYYDEFIYIPVLWRQ